MGLGRRWRGASTAAVMSSEEPYLVDEPIVHQLCGQVLGVISCRDKER